MDSTMNISFKGDDGNDALMAFYKDMGDILPLATPSCCPPHMCPIVYSQMGHEAQLYLDSVPRHGQHSNTNITRAVHFNHLIAINKKSEIKKYVGCIPHTIRCGICKPCKKWHNIIKVDDDGVRRRCTPSTMRVDWVCVERLPIIMDALERMTIK